jgi:uncharacterized membrane protein YhaH (DUF805 family)
MAFLFGFKGRMQRLDWWTAMLISACLSALSLFAFQYLSQTIIDWRAIALAVQQSGSLPTNLQSLFATHQNAVLVSAACLIVSMWILLAANTKRLHDFGQSGWLNLFLVVPLFGFGMLAIFCGFMPGNAVEAPSPLAQSGEPEEQDLQPAVIPMAQASYMRAIAAEEKKRAKDLIGPPEHRIVKATTPSKMQTEVNSTRQSKHTPKSYEMPGAVIR